MPCHAMPYLSDGSGRASSITTVPTREMQASAALAHEREEEADHRR